MKNVSYIKAKWINIFIIFLFSINAIGCSSIKNALSNKNHEQKSVSAQITDSTIITFPDKNLEKTIRQKIQCPTGDILKDDVDNITSLQNTQDKHITNLSGIENLTNLASLNLDNNQISNIKPLEGLTSLTSLNLDNNKISNIEPLKGLTKLTSLNLDTNLISDIEPLKGLINLTKLALAVNQIKDFSPVYAYYKNLKSTDIASNVTTFLASTSVNPGPQVLSDSSSVVMQEVPTDNTQVAGSTIIVSGQERPTNTQTTQSSITISPQKIPTTNTQTTQGSITIPAQ